VSRQKSRTRSLRDETEENTITILIMSCSCNGRPIVLVGIEDDKNEKGYFQISIPD